MTDSNAHEFTVSELAGSLKRTVEDTYGHVRVRGELGRVTIARSGHIYMDLKDDKAVISSIVWKGVAGKLSFRPEEGLEVVAEGKLTTYPGRSQYQLVISQLEPAGAGALMALLEERRKKLTKEGLFAEDKKRVLPYLPEVIGVVTSPTGAVLRDILHRLEDRFPRHVLLWPVLVQGDRAAGQIAEAINGFHAMKPGGDIPRPDLLIIARGGGSVEDLWPFNEEAVVRAASACTIPLISAIGHETDWSLLDLVADVRAPTPTGAAEMAVPVRADLAASLAESDLRLKTGLRRLIETRKMALTAARRGLPKPDDLLAAASQKFDYASSRLAVALSRRVERAELKLQQTAAGLRPNIVLHSISQRAQIIGNLANRLAPTIRRNLTKKHDRLQALAQLLAALSHKSVLGRGFALVHTANKKLITRANALQDGNHVTLEFADGRKTAIIGKASRPKTKAKPVEPEQGDLF
ncbi:Exodeoxyribonuclease VII large subunit [hydrothermal vent metagenome]|uniref:Exodeoxyribonuclease VII large subunit n=1 Tax=hydrothermal vent metagenome TaxID=652676 RepID=A0A3B0SH05_9ZZZZ